MKEITIAGKQYPVLFNMSTLLSFEQITDRSFFGEKFTMHKERLAIIFAALYAADNKTPVSIETLLNSNDWNEINQAFTVVMEMASEFFDIPKVVKDAEDKEIAETTEDEESNAKN